MSFRPPHFITCLVAFAALLGSCGQELLAGTCGDYLQHKAPSEVSANQSDANPDGEFPFAPKPCNGPRCSQAPPVTANFPAPATAAPSETRGEVILPIAPTKLSISSSFWREAPAMNYLYFAAEEIFHPPKNS